MLEAKKKVILSNWLQVFIYFIFGVKTYQNIQHKSTKISIPTLALARLRSHVMVLDLP